MFYGIINICWIPFAGFVSFLVLLSAINKSVGVRRAYVNILLRIFEYGRVSIESASKVNQAIAKDKINVDQTPGVEQVDGSDAKETNEATNGSVLITRDVVLLPEAQESAHDKTNGTKKEEICFDFENCLDYVKSGVEAIIEDDVTSRFEAEELKSWNMLTRTNRHYEFISWKITMIWVIGFAIRYTILMPLRVLVCFIGIGQRHGGFLGVLQRALARASPHIWFERGEAKDRHLVAERLKQHVSDPNNPPILIFPEGTCINNTSVMQFKKGSFEVGGVIYPVAIKYDPRFGDAFWNSSKYSMMQYLYMMMTSWAIVCDVWYLPPMYRQEGESAIDFANRVKGVIAKQGGLVDLVWDGQLKRMKPKKEWREIQQIEFANRLKSD
ncbi:glycerol-3-phosphate acyltransferase 3 isoform X4 [Drosophila sulfurigaster albostrigata]|uniref:glycerol-3-phosphate acyltransferase 3 isoform X4 n=1 Tax=Drosophila sulfurigaster albostrigata TaxID=89887 RepID=UPI002D21B2C1|nr:glycerol-3-phosphate acyltransferase 3 isoform X4 [Drosophila sulfurigaster albostrigata]